MNRKLIIVTAEQQIDYNQLVEADVVAVNKEGKLFIQSACSKSNLSLQLPSVDQITNNSLKELDFGGYIVATCKTNADNLAQIIKEFVPIVILVDTLQQLLIHSYPLFCTDDARVDVIIESTSHPAIRSLLFWVRNNQFNYEETDLETLEAIPSYLRAPVSLRVRFVAEYFPSKSRIIKLKSDDENPGEIYAVLEFKESDILSAKVTIIEPAFTSLFLKYGTKRISGNIIQAPQTPLLTPLKRSVNICESQTLLSDPSISLSQWTSSQEFHSPSISHSLPDKQAIKSHNKTILKKLMLLSLRHVGINKNHGEFNSIWKHLYCACLFAFRKELGTIAIQQTELLSVIRSNMNFLNIK